MLRYGQCPASQHSESGWLSSFALPAEHNYHGLETSSSNLHQTACLPFPTQLHRKGNGTKHRSSQRLLVEGRTCLFLQYIYFALLVAKCSPVPLVCLVSPGHSQSELPSYVQNISKDLTFVEETLNIAPFIWGKSPIEPHISGLPCALHPFPSKVYKLDWKLTLCLTIVSSLEELSWIPVLGTSWLPSLCNHMLPTWAAEQQQHNRRDSRFILTSHISFSRTITEIQSFPVSLQLLPPEKGSVCYT